MVGPTGNRPVQRRKSGTCGRPAGLEKRKTTGANSYKDANWAPSHKDAAAQKGSFRAGLR